MSKRTAYTNTVFVRTMSWQMWMNKQEITLGQPYIKEDRRTKSMPISERIEKNRVTLAQTTVPNWNPDLLRFFLPKSMDQVLEFFKTIGGISSTSITCVDGLYIVLINGEHTAKGKNWVDVFADCLYELSVKGVIK